MSLSTADYQPILYTCDLLYSGMGLPQHNAGVVVVGQAIAATGPFEQLRQNYPQARQQAVGGIIAPPAVNAHTHLDMSAYDFHALPYFDWIPQVVIAQSDKRGASAAKLGAEQLVSGAMPVGDIVCVPSVMETLMAQPNLTGTLYAEILGPHPAEATERFANFRANMQRWQKLLREIGHSNLRLGVSPHATYTLSQPLLKLVAEYAHGEGLPMQIHVAEHPSENKLFATGAGPLWQGRLGNTPDSFAEVIGRQPEPTLTPIRYLDEAGILQYQPALVHMVNVSAEDIQRVSAQRCPVISCPRSNYHLECGRFDFAAFAAAGVEIAFGTDSVASGQTLDIRDELAFAKQLYPELDFRLLLRAAVKGGRRVLGLELPRIRRGEVWRAEYIWDKLKAR